MSHTFLCIRAIPGDTGSVPYEGGWLSGKKTNTCSRVEVSVEGPREHCLLISRHRRLLSSKLLPRLMKYIFGVVKRKRRVDGILAASPPCILVFPYRHLRWKLVMSARKVGAHRDPATGIRCKQWLYFQMILTPPLYFGR